MLTETSGVLRVYEVFQVFLLVHLLRYFCDGKLIVSIINETSGWWYLASHVKTKKKKIGSPFQTQAIAAIGIFQKTR